MLPSRIRHIFTVVLISIAGIMCLVHTVMYNLFGSFFSFADLSYAGEGASFFSLSYLKIRKLLILVVVLCIVGSIGLVIVSSKKKYSYKNLILGMLFVVCGVGGVYYQHTKLLEGVNTTMKWDTAGQSDNDADIYQNMSNKNYAMSMTGIYQYLYRNFMVSSGLENSMNYSEMYKELDEYFEDKAKNQPHEENEMTGYFEGKDVFFIMMESIDTWMLQEEYMPNLYKVQQESIDFTNHYTPLYIAAGTFNTEFVANTGLIPPTAGVDTKVYKNNEFPDSLAKLFSAKGYDANSFHSSNPGIYNRGEIHKNFGYKKYHNWEDMGMDDYMLDSQMINGYDQMVSDNPFFSFIITYSGHGPYTDEMSNISDSHMEVATKAVAAENIKASDSNLKEYTYAIAHAMETDEFIGELMDQLDEDGRLDNTVLIFFTDHYGKYMTNHDFVKELKGADNNDLLCRTPFFIYNKDTQAQKYEKVSSTVDIAPTIANLFNLDADYTYYFGTDLFSGDENYVVFPGNNWYDGETYYSTDYKGKITEKMSEISKEASEKTKYSEYVLKSDYFNELD